MSKPGQNRSAVLQWVVVLGVGVLVVAVVLGLNLISRLSDGQKVLDAASPAFTTQSLNGDKVGLDLISRDVNMADPIVNPRGGAAGEVPALVAYAAQTAHVTPAQALALMQKRFPHTVSLLGALPLSSVTAELPHLLAFLSKLLKLPPGQVAAALKTNFPALNQAITNLPAVTNGWDNVPGIAGLTRFNGAPVKTVPQLRSYYRSDLVPALAAQQGNFDSLNGTSSVNWIAPLLLIVGLVVILFAAVMIFRNRSGVTRSEAIATSVVVPVVGVVVVALVLVLSLVPRTNDGQKLLGGLRPAWNTPRVVGDRAGIKMVSNIVDMEDPIMTPSGGAAAEVPKLIAFVSGKTGLPPSAVLAALKTNFPHTTALLGAIPLTAVSSELTGVVQLLGPGVVTAVPRLAQTVINAPYVTGGWNQIPGAAGLTRFDGRPVKTVPQLRTYLSADVIPVLETQRANYVNLTKTSNIDFIGPLVLIVGVIVIGFGLLMVLLAWRRPGAEPREARVSSPLGAR